MLRVTMNSMTRKFAPLLMHLKSCTINLNMKSLYFPIWMIFNISRMLCTFWIVPKLNGSCNYFDSMFWSHIFTRNNIKKLNTLFSKWWWSPWKLKFGTLICESLVGGGAFTNALKCWWNFATIQWILENIDFPLA